MRMVNNKTNVKYMLVGAMSFSCASISIYPAFILDWILNTHMLVVLSSAKH
jgi:hypothetical protein